MKKISINKEGRIRAEIENKGKRKEFIFLIFVKGENQDKGNKVDKANKINNFDKTDKLTRLTRLTRSTIISGSNP